MSSKKWRAVSKLSNRCTHCSNKAFYNEDTGLFYTLCQRHLEIQREANAKSRAKLKENDDNRRRG